MKPVVVLLSFMIIVITCNFYWNKSADEIPGSHVLSLVKVEANEDTKIRLRLKHKASTLRKFAKGKQFNTTRCFIMDMSIASGKKRFFVYNLITDSAEYSGLVAHGSGSNSTKGLYFSNIRNSNCTSLGNYKIGQAYYGRFGLAYKLHGLDKTNSNAFSRFVVLHAHSCVPDGEINPLELCRSWGCPTVSPVFLTRLKNCLDESKQPILLSIFN